VGWNHEDKVYHESGIKCATKSDPHCTMDTVNCAILNNDYNIVYSSYIDSGINIHLLITLNRNNTMIKIM
jgi:hypothetical protein